MRTSAGKECRYFYGDYFRGRTREECRLLNNATPALNWAPDLCITCPVPNILLANACPYMVLKPSVTRPFPLLKRKVQVTTFCTKTQRAGFDPHIGCGECHSLDSVFNGEPSDIKPST